MDDHIAVIRFVCTCLMAGKAILALHAASKLYGRRLLSEHWPWWYDYRRTIVIGVGVSSLGWAIHQQWFLLWQIIKAQSVRDYLVSSPLVVLPYALIAIGVAMTASGWLSTFVGRWWPVLASAIIAALYLAGWSYVR